MQPEGIVSARSSKASSLQDVSLQLSTRQVGARSHRLLKQQPLITSLDVEWPCLGDFDFGLSAPAGISTRLSSGFRGWISSSPFPIVRMSQERGEDFLRSTFRSSLLEEADMPA